MTIFDHPAVIGVLIAIPSTILGVLGYRRSLKVDKIAEQSGAAAQELDAVGQVIDGLNSLVSSLQEDNKHLRQRVADIQIELKALHTSHDALKHEVESLREPC